MKKLTNESIWLCDMIKEHLEKGDVVEASNLRYLLGIKLSRLTRAKRILDEAEKKKSKK